MANLLVLLPSRPLLQDAAGSSLSSAQSLHAFFGIILALLLSSNAGPLEIGIGFVPFGGIARGAFQAIHGSEEKALIVKATSVRMLAKDPDPRSGKALVAATTDKSWLVRAAAFDALAQRGASKLLPEIQAGLGDEKDVVKLAAAAAVIKLSKPSKSTRP